MPRSASKSFQLNANLYLKSRYSKVLTTVNDQEYGVGEILFVTYKNQQGHVHMFNNMLEYHPGTIEIKQELQTRVELVCSGLPVIAKYFPIQFQPEIEIEFLRNTVHMFDRVYVLQRRDIVEHRRSFCLSWYLDSWWPDLLQQKIIQKTMENPVVFPDELVDWFNKMHKQFSYVIEHLPPRNIFYIFTEDLININTSKDWCEFLCLPDAEFLFYKNGREFGDKKTKMILA